MVTTCCTAAIDDVPAERFLDLKNPIWVVNADLLDGRDLGALVPRWLFDVVMSGKDVMFYGVTDVVIAIGKDLQKYNKEHKAKDPKKLACQHRHQKQANNSTVCRSPVGNVTRARKGR